MTLRDSNVGWCLVDSARRQLQARAANRRDIPKRTLHAPHRRLTVRSPHKGGSKTTPSSVRRSSCPLMKLVACRSWGELVLRVKWQMLRCCGSLRFRYGRGLLSVESSAKLQRHRSNCPPLKNSIQVFNSNCSASSSSEFARARPSSTRLSRYCFSYTFCSARHAQLFKHSQPVTASRERWSWSEGHASNKSCMCHASAQDR